VKSKLQRMSPVEQGDEYHELFGDLVAMEATAAACSSRPTATTLLREKVAHAKVIPLSNHREGKS
jgi:hypothetical protein